MARTNLTPREAEVANLLAMGRSDMQIAGALGISLNTARGYVKTLHIKVGSDQPGNKRVQLAAALGACCLNGVRR